MNTSFTLLATTKDFMYKDHRLEETRVNTIVVYITTIAESLSILRRFSTRLILCTNRSELRKEGRGNFSGAQTTRTLQLPEFKDGQSTGYITRTQRANKYRSFL